MTLYFISGEDTQPYCRNASSSSW